MIKTDDALSYGDNPARKPTTNSIKKLKWQKLILNCFKSLIFKYKAKVLNYKTDFKKKKYSYGQFADSYTCHSERTALPPSYITEVNKLFLTTSLFIKNESRNKKKLAFILSKNHASGGGAQLVRTPS